jgi:hypothetical protein
MKRGVIVGILCVLVACSGVMAQSVGECVSSGLQTTSKAISGTGGSLCGVLVTTDGTNNATVTIYNNATGATAPVLFTATVVGASYFGGGTWDIPIKYNRGLYVAVSGTGASYIIYYK